MKLEAHLKTELDGFTLDLELTSSSSRLVLFGPSGSGKTLTLRCIAGVGRPDEGRVTVDDEALLDTSRGLDVPAQQRHIGYLPQEPALFPHLTVRENILFGVRHELDSETRELADDLLRILRVDDLVDRYPGEISGGQAQRVALVRAMLPRPRLLLLDEPFSALDAPLRLRLREEVLSIQERLGFSMVVVTHDMDEARMLAEELAVIRKGKVLQVAPADEVLEKPSEVCVARLTGARNVLAGEVEAEGEKRFLRAAGLRMPCGCSRRDGGDAITLVLRAEELRLVPEEVEDDGPVVRVPVRILEEVARRHDHTVLVAPPEDERPELEVQVPRWVWREGGFEVGREAWLEIPPEAIHVLDAEETPEKGESAPTCADESEAH